MKFWSLIDEIQRRDGQATDDEKQRLGDLMNGAIAAQAKLTVEMRRDIRGRK